MLVRAARESIVFSAFSEGLLMGEYVSESYPSEFLASEWVSINGG